MRSRTAEPLARVAEALDVAPTRSNVGRLVDDRVIGVASPIILLTLWELAASVGAIDPRFFPAPTRVIGAAIELLQSGELWLHVSASASRIVIGFLLGAIPGIAVGLAVGLFAPLRAALQPLVDATFPIPKIAIFPLLIMIFGIGEESKWAIIAIAVVYLTLINTASGVRHIDRIHFDVAENFGATHVMRFTDVALPGSMPMIMAGVRLAAGVALLVIVSAEFVGAKSGIGFLIWTSWQTFNIEQMYVGLFVSAILGFAIAIGISAAERALIPWRR